MVSVALPLLELDELEELEELLLLDDVLDVEELEEELLDDELLDDELLDDELLEGGFISPLPQAVIAALNSATGIKVLNCGVCLPIIVFTDNS